MAKADNALYRVAPKVSYYQESSRNRIKNREAKFLKSLNV